VRCAAHRTVVDLPAPDTAARAHSEHVVAALRAEIRASGGWIPFARYMEIALYAPGLGYYAAGAAKLGRDGDFVTAPEMSPLFGAALAVQLRAILDATAGRDVVELGAGTGRLAADVLNALAAANAPPARYRILETSPDLRERQRATLARNAPAHAPLVDWVDTLPKAIDGAIVANEVLDAIPVHVVRAHGAEVLERGVGWDDAASRFEWIERPARERLAALATQRLPPGPDYVSEINPVAEALVHSIGRSLEGGAALFIDYGFPAAEYYHPQRSEGTLMCHYRHRAHADPFLWPGLNDITAHVDFTAIAEAGVAAGLHVAGFAPQAPFLVSCGVLDLLAAVGPPDSAPYLQAAAPIQHLLSPAEMGELFKVLALARSEGIDWKGFTLVDRRGRL
jgi:SAM-dependent MidA family methyltransferase